MDFITIDFDKSIDRSAFDCGKHPALNTYIFEHAGQDQKRNLSRTFLYVEDGLLLGYYTLANTSLALSELSDEQRKKMPRYPMPAVLLSRLAVDKMVQGQGLGLRLMGDFFRRVYEISKQSGVAFIVVDAKDSTVADFYRDALGFLPSSNNPLRLVLSTATLIQGFRSLA
ncbi:GNAT family N-acetyltransferase [Pseudomonas sp. S8]|uniref:GNAT family N-acetyltransferase n=1 Tax=Pseudomonas sp. S8 TaxID=211136 RepID=UPI003D2679F2